MARFLRVKVPSRVATAKCSEPQQYLHISTQVPNEWEYVSDGPYRDYMIGKTPLKFKHVMPREINGYSSMTVMVIQGIRAIGKGNITQEQMNRFSTVLTAEDKEILLKEARTASGWIYRIIKNICEVKQK